MEERRKEKRASISLVCRIAIGRADYFGHVKNLSKHGLYLICDQALSLNTIVSLDLDIPQQKSIRVIGEIIWKKDAEPDSGVGHMYGIQIVIKKSDFDSLIDSLPLPLKNP